MAAHGARRLKRMNDNLNVIIGVELICAAQGIEFRAPLVTSPVLQGAVDLIRSEIATLTDDRFMAGDLARAAALVAEGRVQRECDVANLLAGDAA
ncbi:MAG: histidine ammonia-lyase, partial [Hoeflea sp.]|nr:histidine ammonia-lyase [Hoeflea sp.]